MRACDKFEVGPGLSPDRMRLRTARRRALRIAAAVGLLVTSAPVMALAQSAEATEAAQGGTNSDVLVARAFAAAIAMAVSALAAGWAQSRIGAAGAGTLAERPEAGTTIIILEALPDVIVLLGFVIAFMIVGTAQ